MLDRFYTFNASHIMVAQFSGEIRLSDLRTAVAESTSRIMSHPELYTQPGHSVHLILDASRCTGINGDLFNFKTLLPLTQHKSGFSNMGWLIVVDPDPDPVMRFILGTVAQVAHINFRVLPSMDDAFRLTKASDRARQQ